MYVTFPSSESKIFTLSQGHLAATALSQAGSGCDTVKGGAWGQRELVWASKINDAAGRHCWEWWAQGGGHWTGALRAGWGWAGSRACGSGMEGQGGNGRTEPVPGARERKFRVWTGVSSIPTSHQFPCSPSTFSTRGYGHNNLTALLAFRDLLEILLLFFMSALGPVKPSWKLLC